MTSTTRPDPLTAPVTPAARPIVAVERGQPASDGAGVRLTRMLGTARLPDLDPFLMLDQIRSDQADDYIAGFPDHPHRGFETVTVMIDGRMRHGDNQGNSGLVEAGGVQWMTAGRGIVHSEIPEQEDGMLWGFQLWVNLPSALKMTAPTWRDFRAEEIPSERRGAGVTVRVMSGLTTEGTEGPARSAGEAPLLLDVMLDPGASFHEVLDARYETAFIAVYTGAVRGVDGHGRETLVTDPSLAVFGPGAALSLTAGEKGARFLVVAGRPLGEPVARMGPFVMNTEAELLQAFNDYRSGMF